MDIYTLPPDELLCELSSSYEGFLSVGQLRGERGGHDEIEK